MENRYEEMLERLTKKLFEDLDALEYAIELDSEIGESQEVANAVGQLKRAIERII